MRVCTGYPSQDIAQSYKGENKDSKGSFSLEEIKKSRNNGCELLIGEDSKGSITMPWRLEDHALDLDDRPTADNCRYNEFP